MDKYLKCKGCGTVIDTETGEHHISEESNAFKFKTLQEKYDKSQSDLKRSLDANAELLERIKDEGDETTDGDTDETTDETTDGDTDETTDGDTGGEGIWED